MINLASILTFRSLSPSHSFQIFFHTRSSIFPSTVALLTKLFLAYSKPNLQQRVLLPIYTAFLLMLLRAPNRRQRYSFHSNLQTKRTYFLSSLFLKNFSTEYNNQYNIIKFYLYNCNKILIFTHIQIR